MHLNCTMAKGLFAAEGFQVVNDKPLPFLWDCHHGNTFVLMVQGLLAEPFSGENAAEPLILELDLTPWAEVHGVMELFAAAHNLPLTPLKPLPETLEEPLTLAACHLPGASLFIYCETATLTARATPRGNIRLAVQGSFKSRKVPCRETDLLLHLERPGSTRLLSYAYTLVRQRL